MSYTVKLVQQRDNTSTNFWSQSNMPAETISKMDELKASGEIISYDLSDGDPNALSKVMSITFRTPLSAFDAEEDPAMIKSAKERATYCLANNISWSVETY
jgi:hypothetical protein